MDPRRRKLFVRASSRLAQAEALARVPVVMGGPSDTPPTSTDPGTVSSWLNDFAARARAALGAARKWVADGAADAKGKARDVARAVLDAEDDARRAATGVVESAGTGILDAVRNAARTLLAAAGAASALSIVGGAVVVYLLLRRR